MGRRQLESAAFRIERVGLNRVAARTLRLSKFRGIEPLCPRIELHDAAGKSHKIES